jgi:hypothetical protein
MTLTMPTMLVDILSSLEMDALRVEAWAYDPYWDGQEDMRALFLADAADIRKVAKFCKEGDWKSASNTMYHMDTAARDEINDKAYNYIREIYS